MEEKDLQLLKDEIKISLQDVKENIVYLKECL